MLLEKDLFMFKKLDDKSLSEEELKKLGEEFEKINHELENILDEKIYTENELEAELEKIGCN